MVLSISQPCSQETLHLRAGGQSIVALSRTAGVPPHVQIILCTENMMIMIRRIHNDTSSNLPSAIMSSIYLSIYLYVCVLHIYIYTHRYHHIFTLVESTASQLAFMDICSMLAACPARKRPPPRPTLKLRCTTVSLARSRNAAHDIR